ARSVPVAALELRGDSGEPDAPIQDALPQRPLLPGPSVGLPAGLGGLLDHAVALVGGTAARAGRGRAATAAHAEQLRSARLWTDQSLRLDRLGDVDRTALVLDDLRPALRHRAGALGHGLCDCGAGMAGTARGARGRYQAETPARRWQPAAGVRL